MAERLLTPSKITAWLDCAHYLTLKHEVEAGVRESVSSPFGEMAQMLLEKGMEHERAVLDRYRAEGLSVFEVPDRDRNESFQRWVDRVGNPLADGHDIVFQLPGFRASNNSEVPLCFNRQYVPTGVRRRVRRSWPNVPTPHPPSTPPLVRCDACVPNSSTKSTPS